MLDDAIKKFLNLNNIYIFSCIMFLLLINSDKNVIDIIYFQIITIYYLVLRNHRKN